MVKSFIDEENETLFVPRETDLGSLLSRNHDSLCFLLIFWRLFGARVHTTFCFSHVKKLIDIISYSTVILSQSLLKVIFHLLKQTQSLAAAASPKFGRE